MISNSGTLFHLQLEFPNIALIKLYIHIQNCDSCFLLCVGAGNWRLIFSDLEKWKFYIYTYSKL